MIFVEARIPGEALRTLLRSPGAHGLVKLVTLPPGAVLKATEFDHKTGDYVIRWAEHDAAEPPLAIGFIEDQPHG